MMIVDYFKGDIMVVGEFAKNEFPILNSSRSRSNCDILEETVHTHARGHGFNRLLSAFNTSLDKVFNPHLDLAMFG